MATLAQRDAARQFAANLPVINGMIGRYCRSDEARQNALCWSWHWFTRYVQTHPAEQAAIASARYAVKLRFRTYGRQPRSTRYLDAHDYAEPLAVDPATCPRENAVELSWRIEDMPIRIRPVAIALGAGLSKSDAARVCGISRMQVHRLCREIADWINGVTLGAGRRVAA